MNFRACRTAIRCILLLPVFVSVHAAVVTVNESNATNTWTLPSGTNLLNGATANTPSAPQQPDHGGSDQAATTWAVLTNNTVGAAADKLQSVTPNDGNSVIFPLNLSVNPNGYNISQFDAYAAWPDTGRDNLDFTVFYSTVAAPTTFIQLAVVANHTGSDIATHTRLTDSAGILASGVHSFKFVFGSPTGQENGYAGYREFIAQGTAATPPVPLMWTGNGGSAGNANWTVAADNNWKKSADGIPANFNPSSPLTFDDTGLNRNISVTPDLMTAASLTFTNNVGAGYVFTGQQITSNSGITSTGSGDVVFNNTLQAPGLVLSGSGGVSLNATNPALTGNIAVSNGTLNVGNNGAIGSAALVMTGGTARFTTLAPTVAGLSGIGGSIVLGKTPGAAATRLSVDSAISTSFGGSIYQVAGAVGSFTKSGDGSLGLAGDNSYAGSTSVAGGALWFEQRLALYHGSTASWTAANIQVGSGATLGFKVGGTGEFTAGDLSAVDLGGFDSGSVLAIETNANLILSRNLDRSIGLSKSGAASLTLAGANTYTGATKVLAGLLAVSGDSIPNASMLVLDGGKVSIASAATETVGSLYYGSVQQPAGTYGSTVSGAAFKDDSRFSGTGILVVSTDVINAWATPNAISWTPTSILNWNPATDRNAPYGVSTVPLAARFAPPGAGNTPLNTALNVNSNARPNEGRVEALVGFSSDASQGIRSTRFYVPTVWQYIDVMGYWAGAVASICIPPSHVVDAAHRNGVPVLGNVFLAPTAYGGNIARVNEFLTNRPDGSFPVADKMIQAAQYFKFDGWFINMETGGGNTATATAMQAFLKYCKAQAPAMQISWYDSMVSNGNVSWQRRLNSSNQMFFQAGTKVSDSMFLDFYWQGGSAITSSASLAQSLGRSPYDIYAGIDTEGAGDSGTNTWGGSTPIDWAQLFPTGQPHRASLGIYRPEWTFNYSGNPTDAINRETRYWSGQNSDPSNTSIPAGSTNPNWPGIANFIPAKSPLSTLPFVTNFNLGQGDRFMVDGVSKLVGPWTNLSLQDILPTWKWIVTSAGTKLSPGFDYGTAYYGGTSLKVTGTLTAGQPNEIKLYQTSLPVDASTSIRLIYKPSAASSAQVQVGYAFEDAPGTMYYSTVGTSASTNWTTLNSSLSAFAGKKIALITLKLSSASTISSYAVNIGRLQVTNGTAVAPAPPSGLTLEGKGRNPDEAFGSQLWLSWSPSPDPVLHYNVYYRPDLTPANDSKRVWLGSTPNHYLFTPDVRRFALETSGFIQVEAVGPDFGVSPSISTVQPTFDFEEYPNLTHPVIPTYPVPAPLSVIASSYKADNVNAFDNSFITTVEPGSYSGEWIGLDLGAGNARQITAVRFVPRATLASRMVNGIFQGSNNSDFSAAVELARVNVVPPDNAETTLLINVVTPFRYLRYVSPDNGFCNVAEIKYFSAGNAAPQTPPVNLQGIVSGTTASLTWSAPYVGVPFGYNVKRSTLSGGPYTTLATGLATTSFQNTGLSAGTTYYYVVTTTNSEGESAGSAQLTLNPSPALKLTGTPIGGGSPLNSGTVYSKAFDGSMGTYFESTDATGWTGLDFGAGNGKIITGVRYSPRNTDTSNTNNSNLLLAGRFQASNTSDFSSGVVTFITLNSTPGYNLLTAVGVIPSATTYRYVRYVTSTARVADIAEIEFYGGTLPASPDMPTASARDATAALGWAAVSGASRYMIYRSDFPGGPYVAINSNVTALTFTDAGLIAGNSYYYQVAAVNSVGEGPPSAEVVAFDHYARWLMEEGQIAGNPNTAFNQDSNGNGVQNGAEYMIPKGVKTTFPSGGITAVLRDDDLVATTLWESPDLAEWSPASLVEARDQAGVDPGFHRVEGPAPAIGQTQKFYRFGFAR